MSLNQHVLRLILGSSGRRSKGWTDMAGRDLAPRSRSLTWLSTLFLYFCYVHVNFLGIVKYNIGQTTYITLVGIQEKLLLFHNQKIDILSHSLKGISIMYIKQMFCTYITKFRRKCGNSRRNSLWIHIFWCILSC